MNKHSLIHSPSLVNCSRFCELACIINYHTQNVRVFVLSWEVTCMSLFLFVAVQLLDWEEHQNAYAEGDDVCRNVVGRNSNWNLLCLLHRERMTSELYFVMYLWHSELALKVSKRITLLLLSFCVLFLCFCFFFKDGSLHLNITSMATIERKFTSLRKR